MVNPQSAKEVRNYDLGETGVMARLQCQGQPFVGWQIDATGSSDFAVDYSDDGENWYENAEEYDAEDRVDDGATVPERYVRIRNTTETADETANVLISASG